MLILVKLVVVITRQWGKGNIFKFLAFFRSHLLVPLQWLLLVLSLRRIQLLLRPLVLCPRLVPWLVPQLLLRLRLRLRLRLLPRLLQRVVR